MEEKKKRALICDSCRHRKACSEQAFPCGFMRTRGDQLMDEMGCNEVAMSKYDTSKYILFSQIVTHGHDHPTNPPEWLDLDRNTCKHYVSQEFDIESRFSTLGKKVEQPDVWWD